MTLRGLENKDLDSWLVLWSGYQDFYNVKISSSVTEGTFARLLDPNEGMKCLVIEDHGEIIGFVHYIFHRSTWTAGNYCYLQDLYVTPTKRSKGVGKKLIEAVYREAKDSNCSRVYWLTHETNYKGRLLYDSVADNAGFIQYRKNIE